MAELKIPLTLSQSGSSTDPGKNSPSLSQFLDTLIPVALVAAVYVVIFLILRRRLKRNYTPRSYLGSLRPQSVPSPNPTESSKVHLLIVGQQRANPRPARWTLQLDWHVQ